MTSRRDLLAAALALALGAGLPAPATAAPFEAAAFDAAVTKGGPVLIHIGAPWCPICRAQKPVLDALLEDRRFAGFAAFEIDFDTAKADVRKVGAQLQSTLIVYKGGREVGRSVGESQPEWIEDLLEKAL